MHAALYPPPDPALVEAELEAEMDVVQRLVVMGRALRERAGIKTRQPLRAIHVRSSDAESLRLLGEAFATEQVLDELNVKAWGSLEADDGKLCRLAVKPNFRALGKKLGPAHEGRRGEDLSARRGGGGDAARRGRTVTLELPPEGDGGAIDLGPDDVQIQVESQADFDVETGGRFIAWLDVELDRELLDEGLAREVVNRLNALR